jgi:hypothetical protein
MKNVPVTARIGFLIFCIALAVLLLTHLITIVESSFLFAIGLVAFGIIRRKEKNNKSGRSE